MNKYTAILYEEHAIIMDAIDVARQLGSIIGKDNALYEKSLTELLEFFRRYADGYHHYKEELVLFPEMNKRNSVLEEGIIREMFENHEMFRDLTWKIEKSLQEHEYENAQATLMQYTEQLSDHIAVENDELFLMTDSLFSDTELESIHFRFSDCDRELGEDAKNRLCEIPGMIRSQISFFE